MQLMWLSGPTARMVTVSIGRRAILRGVLGAAVALVALGGVLQWLGIRVAVEAHPTLARALGGVTSTQEQQRIEQRYEQQIARLQGRIETLSGQVEELAAAKQAVVDLIPTPRPRAGRGGQGGPLERILDFSWFAPRASDGLRRVDDDAETLDRRIRALSKAWQSEFGLVSALPLQAPLPPVEQFISSPFGVRHDPLNGSLARHAGTDFVAPLGTPVLATAPGTVLQAGPLGAYGLAVDVDHGGGFTTRYAHNHTLLVKAGERVVAGQALAKLGNTGRSTGAHLHYEVRFKGQPIEPGVERVLAVAKDRRVAAETDWIEGD